MTLKLCTSAFFLWAVSIVCTTALSETRIPMKTIGGQLKCTLEQLKPSSEVPTNVNKVRPADIKIIGALGDSISLASSSFNFPNESRTVYPGNSFATGVDEPLENHVTVANILRKFSPSLRGLSYGAGMSKVGFNVAVSGSTTRNLTRQATTLVRRMAENGVNITADWKIITLFIGTNDVGDIQCRQKQAVPIAQYKANIEKALQILKNGLPRSIVTILAMWPVELAIEAKREVKPQDNLFKCVSNDAKMTKLRTLCDGYRAAVYEIQNERKYHDKDFTVVVQGFADEYNHAFRNSSALYDSSFYTWDTFHISKYGNAVMARELWNNLLQPVGRKTTYADLGNDLAKISCPTKRNPYIYTVDNSYRKTGCK